MATKKVIAVNESSLVDLKAELYRKESQVKREKVGNTQPKKVPIWQKKKKEGKKKDGKASIEETASDHSYDQELEKSRLMLEAKSALYNKLSTGEIEVPSDEDEQEGRFLVDFHQKTLPKTARIRDENVDSSGQKFPAAASPDEEWVEYVDSFGRSRKCLRKDLPQMKARDETIKERKPLETESNLTLLSDDMRRELIRKKWQEEVQDALDKPEGPLHYQDVLFNETRDHGVGYYKFSKVEEERQQQQTALNKLRAQTEQQRSKREKLLEKRKAATNARLAKIRERKQRKLREEGVVEHEEGTVDNETDKRDDILKETPEKEEETSKDDMFIGTMVERIRNKNTRERHKNEWEKRKVDLEMFEKPKTPSYDPRSERNPEFAPPTFYEKKPRKRERRGAEIDTSDVESLKTQQNSENNCGEDTSIKPEHYQSEETISSQNCQTSNDIRNLNPQSTNSNAQNARPYHSMNPNDYSMNSNFQDTNPNLYNAFPNLPPPPIHSFPPPNFPPFHAYPPQQLFPPQYPPNTTCTPNYQYPTLPNTEQYTNVPQ